MMSRIIFSGVLLCLMSCSQGSSGPERYSVEGIVTFEGKAIPMGTISFSPDKASGHPGGPGVSMDFRNGVYKTERSSGVTAGPHTVTIFGYEGIQSAGASSADVGQALFPCFEVTYVFPPENSKVNFEVPVRHK